MDGQDYVYYDETYAHIIKIKFQIGFLVKRENGKKEEIGIQQTIRRSAQLYVIYNGKHNIIADVITSDDDVAPRNYVIK